MGSSSTKEWTEFFAPMTDVDEAAMYSANYTATLAAVASWLESAQGVPKATYDSVDSWLAQVATKVPTEILHEGGPWGAIEQQRQELAGAGSGAQISKSMPFSVSDRDTAEARPWLELLHNGSFSAELLKDDVPLSWMVAPEWEALLQASAKAHGTNWLLECHLGVMRAGVFDLPGARAHFNASMKLRPTAMVARNLAALSDGAAAERWALYQHAWQLALQSQSGSAKLLRYHLAGEIGQFLDSVSSEFHHHHHRRHCSGSHAPARSVRCAAAVHRHAGLGAWLRRAWQLLRQRPARVRCAGRSPPRGQLHHRAADDRDLALRDDGRQLVAVCEPGEPGWWLLGRVRAQAGAGGGRAWLEPQGDGGGAPRAAAARMGRAHVGLKPARGWTALLVPN